MSSRYIQRVRTTVRLNDALLKAAKKSAAERNISLTKLIEEALLEKLYRKKGSDSKREVHLVTFRGNGLKSGVDLDDSASLLDLLGG